MGNGQGKPVDFNGDGTCSHHGYMQKTSNRDVMLGPDIGYAFRFHVLGAWHLTPSPRTTSLGLESTTRALALQTI